MKREIDVLEYASHILKEVRKGVLITSKAGDRVNSMTISWGTLGIEWNNLIFTTFVRTGRFTRELLDEGGTFTVNIPVDICDRKPMGYCGAKSGRDTDKIKDMGFTLVESDLIDAPGIKEYPLTLECKIVHKQLQDRDALDEEMMVHYPQDVDSSCPTSNKDFHIAYSGKIVKAYIIED